MHQRGRQLGVVLTLFLFQTPVAKATWPHAKFHGMFHLAPSYLHLSQAIQNMNLAMQLLKLNPMDDWRRREVQKARVEVIQRTSELHADVAKGNLEPSDVEAAKQDLAVDVDISSILNSVSPPADDGRAAAEGSDSGSVEMDGGAKTVMEDAPAPVAAFAGTDFGAGAASLDAIADEQEKKALIAKLTHDDEADPVHAIVQGAEGSSLRQLDNLGGIAFASAGEETQHGSAKSAGSGEGGQALKQNGSIPGAPDGRGPNGKAALAERKTSGAAKLAAVKRAVAKLKPHTPIRALVSTKGGPSLHVSGFLPGGTVIQGDFGEGIVAVQLKETDEGYEVVELTDQSLWKLYLELAFYWALILIPIGYGTYRWVSARVPARQSALA